MTNQKSVWGGIGLDDERSKETCRSWFSGMADGMEPVKAEILERLFDGKEMKLRVLFREPNGTEHEMVRTLGGKTFSITSRRLSGSD